MEKHKIFGVLRLRREPLAPYQPKKKQELPNLSVALEDGNYITHLGRWLSQHNLEGKKVKITIEEI